MKRQIVAILIVGLLLAADDPKQAAVKMELEKLAGEWQLVSAEKDGKKLPPEQLNKKERVVIKGDQYTVLNGAKVLQRSTLMIDSTTNPKTIDRSITDGVNKGQKYLGIYELDGDTLRECSVTSGRERPKEFAGGNGVRLFVSKRVKP
jgi:uncharacterized protein (TIGR03067 family)